MSINLTPEQAAVVENRGGELLVSAAAGSGKTRVLVERLLRRVVEEGLDLDQFLVITFTKAAASELRDKILAELNRRLAETPGDRHLRRQTTLIYRAQISTIHAFCTTFLRENSHLLDLDPDFRVADDAEAELLRVQALDHLLEERYEHLAENGFGRLVDSLSAGRDDKHLREIVLDIHSHIQSHPDPAQWLREQAAEFDLRSVTDVAKTRWGQLLMEDAKAQTQYWFQQMSGALDLLQESGDEVLEKGYSESICSTMDGLDDFINALDRQWNSAHLLSEIPFPTLKGSRKVQDKETKELVQAIRKKCMAAMKKLQKRFECTSEELLADMEQMREPVTSLFQLVVDLIDQYGALKQRRKLLDFNDLEHFTVSALLKDNQPTELAQIWVKRYAEVMVDEYQDTNAVQNAIFDALTHGGKTLFQVGDVKQSIYRFRLADPTIFLKKYHTFRHAEAATDGQARRLTLSRNFRSRSAVLDSVNFLFSHIMTVPFGELDYSEDQRLNLGLVDQIPRADGETELNLVDLSTIEKDDKVIQRPRDEVEAQFVAQRIRTLLDEPFLVTEGTMFRPIRPEDIAILYRSPGSVLNHLTRALDEQNIPWQNEGYEDFFTSTEVSVALSFLQIIDNPRQDVPLISVLRSPVYGFTPDQLAQLRANGPQNSDFYACVEQGAEDGLEHCLRFLDDLKLLRLRMIDSSCAQLLWYLYDQLGLLSLFGSMTGGQRRQENLLSFYDYARSFEGQGHRGIFTFVSQLRRLMEQGKPPQAVAKSRGLGVQIMSIHKSKGLEFPVVVLAGLNRRFNRSDETAPMLFHSVYGVGPKLLDPELRVEFPTLARTAVQLKLDQEMKAEELRLLYVAMTRAQEKLIMVMSFRDAEKDLRKLLMDASPHPEPEALSAQDSMGKWVLLPVLARRDAEGIRFGERPLCYAEAEDHWNIRLIRAGNDCFSPQPDTTTEKPAEEATLPDHSGLARHLLWHYPYEGLEDMASKATATQLKGRLLDEEAAEETVPSPRPLEFRRPTFEQVKRGLTPAQAGSAIHTVMERIHLDKADRVETVKEEIARLVQNGYLTEAQGQVVDPRKVAWFWASPLGQEARTSGSLRREFKFSILSDAKDFYQGAPDGESVLLQGVVDCFFETPSGITVIDFKSDKVYRGYEMERAEQYRIQVETYAKALEEVFGCPVARKYIWFFHTNQAVEIK